MINLQNQNQDTLERIRAAVLTQEHTTLGRIAHEEVAKAGQIDNVALAKENLRGNGSIAWPGTKKRRRVRFANLWTFSLASLFSSVLSSLSSVLRPSFLLLIPRISVPSSGY
jgi:hypothetical protein